MPNIRPLPGAIQVPGNIFTRMKNTLLITLLALLFTGLTPAPAETPATLKRTEDVIYGRKSGTALTLDVFQPEKPNGFGVAMMVLSLIHI